MYDGDVNNLQTPAQSHGMRMALVFPENSGRTVLKQFGEAD